MRVCVIVLAMMAGCGVDLERGLDGADANRAIRELARAGIVADKVADDGGSFKIVVDRVELGHAAEVLAVHDLPRRARPLPPAPFLPTPADERARFAATTAVDIERSLEAIPGVVSAHVHLALPSPGDPLDPVAPVGTAGTAAVVLKTESTVGPSDDALKALVAAAVPQLAAGNVQLVRTIMPAPVSSAPMLTRVGPVEVAPQSRGVALALALAAALAILTLAALLGNAALRLRQLRARRS